MTGHIWPAIWPLSARATKAPRLEELRGFASDNIFEAFALGQLQASGTRCEKPFFHVQVRTPEGGRLEPGAVAESGRPHRKAFRFSGPAAGGRCFTGKTATSTCTWSGHASATTCTRLIPAFTKESSRRFAASLRRKWACSRFETSAIRRSRAQPGGASMTRPAALKPISRRSGRAFGSAGSGATMGAVLWRHLRLKDWF